jgi:putative FmdB family regulatory protein
MPIYAYRCTSCGHAQDVLQKISDPVLTVCPACGDAAYAKQVTAAGFQLKGSGWYATDFRGGNAAKPDAATSDKPAEAAKPAEGGTSTAPAPAAASPAPAPAAPAPSPSSSGS